MLAILLITFPFFALVLGGYLAARRHMLPLGDTTFLDEETGATLAMELGDTGVQRIVVLVDGKELMSFDPEGEQG